MRCVGGPQPDPPAEGSGEAEPAERRPGVSGAGVLRVGQEHAAAPCADPWAGPGPPSGLEGAGRAPPPSEVATPPVCGDPRGAGSSGRVHQRAEHDAVAEDRHRGAALIAAPASGHPAHPCRSPSGVPLHEDGVGLVLDVEIRHERRRRRVHGAARPQRQLAHDLVVRAWDVHAAQPPSFSVASERDEVHRCRVLVPVLDAHDHHVGADRDGPTGRAEHVTGPPSVLCALPERRAVGRPRLDRPAVAPDLVARHIGVGRPYPSRHGDRSIGGHRDISPRHGGERGPPRALPAERPGGGEGTDDRRGVPIDAVVRHGVDATPPIHGHRGRGRPMAEGVRDVRSCDRRRGRERQAGEDRDGTCRRSPYPRTGPDRHHERRAPLVSTSSMTAGTGPYPGRPAPSRWDRALIGSVAAIRPSPNPVSRPCARRAR